MAVNAFVTFYDKADGESIQKGKEKWVEDQGLGLGRRRRDQLDQGWRRERREAATRAK